MHIRTLTPLSAVVLVLLLGCPSGPPPLELTGESTVVDGAEQVNVVVQTRKGEVVQIYPGFEEVTADADGRAEFLIVPAADELNGPTIRVTATIRLKGDPPILEKTIEVPRLARLVHHEVLPKVNCSDGTCGIAVDRDLRIRTFGLSGTETTVGGVSLASSAPALPPRGVLNARNLDEVLGGTDAAALVPVRVVKDGRTFEGDLRLKRTDIMAALEILLAEVPNGPVDLPAGGTGAALAWTGVSGHWPLEFFGEVTKLGDIGRVAVAETETTGKRSCGVYGNEQGDTQRQRLEVMKVTVVVYDVRTGDQVTRKTFLPPARCPETARKGKKTTVILPSERDIASWLKAQ